MRSASEGWGTALSAKQLPPNHSRWISLVPSPIVHNDVAEMLSAG